MSEKNADTPEVNDDYDDNLWRQIGGKLYAKKMVDKKPKVVCVGAWNFQFSDDESKAVDIIVTYADPEGIAAAAGIPAMSLGKMKKNSVEDLSSWIESILQKMKK